jgi:hypothetical protein
MQRVSLCIQELWPGFPWAKKPARTTSSAARVNCTRLADTFNKPHKWPQWMHVQGTQHTCHDVLQPTFLPRALVTLHNEGCAQRNHADSIRVPMLGPQPARVLGTPACDAGALLHHTVLITPVDHWSHTSTWMVHYICTPPRQVGQVTLPQGGPVP